MSKLSIKRLTSSDLTFFEWHFRHSKAGNQKAINLNADVFIHELFPSLPQVALGQGGRIPVDLYIYGPGLEKELNLQRKILKSTDSYKNWRLDGEFIHNPPDGPDRFNALAPDDIVILEFSGDVVPNAARAFFLASTIESDRSLHSLLNRRLGDRSMRGIDHHELEELILRAAPQEEHPTRELLLEADLEDAALGGAHGIERLSARRSGRQLSKLAVIEARKRADEVGERGEEFINAYFETLKTEGRIKDFQWVSADNAISPYDFWMSQDVASRLLLDVKATCGEFERLIHVSQAELRTMRDSHERYDIYRVYSLADTSAKVRVAENVREFAKSILKVLERLPAGVLADGVSIDPASLRFGAEVTIRLGSEAGPSR